MSNRVVHFEIPVDDPEKTMKFFKDVFNWTFQKMEHQEYWLAITGDPKSPGIEGAIMKKSAPLQSIVNSIDVADIDATLANIEKAGGKIVIPKAPIPTVGWIAYFTDPDGNIHGAFQSDPEVR